MYMSVNLICFRMSSTGINDRCSWNANMLNEKEINETYTTISSE